jgi:hypothetical protein
VVDPVVLDQVVDVDLGQLACTFPVLGAMSWLILLAWPSRVEARRRINANDVTQAIVALAACSRQAASR